MGSGVCVSLLESLGLDPEDFTWHDIALCGGIDNPEYLFDEYEKKVNVAKTVDDMCLSCPAMKACATTGQEERLTGVWGGIYWNGAGAPDEDRNSHKTPEVWQAIRERLSE